MSESTNLSKFEVVYFNEKTRAFEEPPLMGRKKKEVAKVDVSGDTTQLITTWKEKVEVLATVKSEESQLRVKLVSDLFDATVLEGTHRVDIGWGYQLKVIKNLDYSMTNDANETVNLLGAVAAIDPALASRLVRWKPEPSTPALRDLFKLSEEHPELKQLMTTAITAKPGMPQLELEAPKAAAPEPAPVAIDDGFAVTDGSNIKW